MRVIILTILINSFMLVPLSAQDLKCSESGTRIIFVNGVLTDYKRAFDNNEDLDKVINSELVNTDGQSMLDKKNLVEVRSSYYNNTANIFIDFFEAIAQSINSQTNGEISIEEAFVLAYKYVVEGADTNQILDQEEYQEILAQAAQELATETSDNIELLRLDFESVLTSKKKLIVVSHSQGNFFATSALEALKQTTTTRLGQPFQYSKFEKVIGNLRVASPEDKEIAYSTKTVTNSLDFLLWPIISIPAGTPEATFTLIRPNPIFDLRKDKADIILNHGFSETYLFRFSDYLKEITSYDELIRAEVISTNSGLDNLGKFTINELRNVALGLESNCESKLCKDLSTGVEHETKPHINPDGSPGGRVSVDAYVAPTAIVRSEAVVCGRAKVLDYASVYDNARIEGKAIVSKSAGILGNAIVSDTAYVTDGAIVSDNSLVLGNAVVAGNTFIYGNSAILDEAIVEGSISSVALSTGVTSIKDTIIGGTAYVRNVFSLSESSDISYITDNSIVFDSYISDGATLADQAFVTGNADIFGQVTILDNSTFSGGRIFGIDNQHPITMNSAIVADDALVGGEVVLANDSLIFQNVSISQRALLLDSSSMSGNSNLGGEAVILEQGQISDGASVSEWAAVRNMASVIGNTRFFGKSLAADNSIFAGSAQALDNIRISGHAIVDQNARIAGNVQISGRARIFGSTYVIDNVLISDDAQVSGNSFLRENARIGGNARVEDYAQISGLAVVAGNAAIKDYATVFGSAVVAGNVTIKDYSAAFGTANLVSLEPVIIERGFAVCSPEQSLSMSVDESYNFCSAYF